MKIAAQMYSVRNTAQKGYRHALETVAAIGFQAVEPAEWCGYGEFNGNPRELKKCLDDLGLTACSVHLSADAFLNPEKRAGMIDFYSVLGTKYIICPGDGRFPDPYINAKFADDCNAAAAELKKAGMYCGFHNHQLEFLIDPNTGKTFWETFADRTSSDVVLEQDCGWSTLACQDPADLIRKYPGRSGILHFKPAVRCSEESVKQSIIGKDSVDWKSIIKAAEQYGGTEFAVIEQEWFLPGKTDVESLAASFQGLMEILHS